MAVIYRCMCSGATVPEEEIRQAEEKFVESKELAETAMHNLLTNDVSHFNRPCLLACVSALPHWWYIWQSSLLLCHWSL